jgi:hypothetical protein
MAEPITDVPPDKVGETVQDFIDFGDAAEVSAVRQPNGKYTVTLGS